MEWTTAEIEGKFSEGGRMGFEPVESVGLAAKESAQEILKIFNQGARAKGRSLLAPQHPMPSGLSALILSVSGVRMGGEWPHGRPPYPDLPAPPLALRGTLVHQYGVPTYLGG